MTGNTQRVRHRPCLMPSSSARSGLYIETPMVRGSRCHLQASLTGCHLLTGNNSTSKAICRHCTTS